MTHHTTARQHWLSVGGSNYSDKDHFPDMGTTQPIYVMKVKFYTLPTDLPLQLHIRSGKKSDDIIPVKRTGSRPLFPFCQPKSKGDLTGGLAR